MAAVLGLPPAPCRSTVGWAWPLARGEGWQERTSGALRARYRGDQPDQGQRTRQSGTNGGTPSTTTSARSLGLAGSLPMASRSIGCARKCRPPSRRCEPPPGANPAPAGRRKKELDKRRTKPYWNTPLELSARSFESYLIAKLNDQSAANDYLANVVDEKVWNISEEARATFFGGEAVETYLYPGQAELPQRAPPSTSFFRR